MILLHYLKLASQVAQTVKNLPANAGHPGSILGLERSPEDGNDYTLQYSYLENSMDRLAMGSQRVGHDWATNYIIIAELFLYIHVRL